VDQESLVEMQIDDGAKIIEKLREGNFDVVAAWWMRTSEEGEWFLYIASQEVPDNGIAAAYRKLHSLIRSLGTLWVERFEVKLVEPENPITKDVVRITDRFPGPWPTRYGGKKLGNGAIDGAYIYPRLAPA
jgi:hypothetical protein